MKEDVMHDLENPGVVPVIRLNTGEKLFPLVEALEQGGLRAFELTMTMPSAPELLSACRKRFPSLRFGMGTVTNGKDSRAALSHGAEFLVSPFPAFEALETARGISSDPLFLMGAFTPYEVRQAYEAGADYVKIFPLNLCGPGYLRDLLGPMPYLKLFPTGGIGLDEIEKIFACGARGCGVGGAIFDSGLIETDNWEEIAARARRFVAAVPAGKKRRDVLNDRPH